MVEGINVKLYGNHLAFWVVNSNALIGAILFGMQVLNANFRVPVSEQVAG